YNGGGAGGRYDDRGYDDRSRGGGYGGSSSGGGGGAPNKWAAAAEAAETGARGGYGNSGPKYQGWENVDDEEENYDDEGYLARKTRKVQNDSLESTRRAVAKLQQSEETAMRSLNTMNKQSEQLYSIDRRLDSAENHAKISETKAAELKTLNRFFMLPTFGAGKKSKKIEERLKAEEEENAAREDERKARMEDAMGSGGKGYYQSDDQLNRSSNSRDNGGGGSRWGRKGPKEDKEDIWRNNGGSYSTPDGLERDELEEEIDSNLDVISSGLARLRMMGQTMNSELDGQNQHIHKITEKTDIIKERVDRTTDKVNAVVNKGRKKK
ncbi:hypothetical protein HK101_003412, partial [Irineochytrium annulatum]